jgi:hypothetical protein
MGFTIETYQIYGLPPLPNIYISIKGSYTVKKQLVPVNGNTYIIAFTTYFQASQEAPVITQKEMSFSVQSLPSPADLYSVIYENIKLTLDSKYGTDQQTLVFTDDLQTIGPSAFVETVAFVEPGRTIETAPVVASFGNSATPDGINTDAINQEEIDTAKERYELIKQKAAHYRTSSGRLRLADLPEERTYPSGVFSPPSDPGEEPELKSL